MTSLEEHLGPLYGDGARALQDEFDSRRLADRLADLTVHTVLYADDQELIRAQPAAWIATVDAEGWPDVSYKGGDPGFVEVVSPTELRIPIYNGNGMWRTLGNVRDDGRVALLFIDEKRPWRVRVHGVASVLTDGESTARHVGAEAVLVVQVGRVFPNCGRYIHQGGEMSPFVPRPDTPAPTPEWKLVPLLNEVLPHDDPAFGGQSTQQ